MPPLPKNLAGKSMSEIDAMSQSYISEKGKKFLKALKDKGFTMEQAFSALASQTAYTPPVKKEGILKAAAKQVGGGLIELGAKGEEAFGNIAKAADPFDIGYGSFLQKGAQLAAQDIRQTGRDIGVAEEGVGPAVGGFLGGTVAPVAATAPALGVKALQSAKGIPLTTKALKFGARSGLGTTAAVASQEARLPSKEDIGAGFMLDIILHGAGTGLKKIAPDLFRTAINPAGATSKGIEKTAAKAAGKYVGTEKMIREQTKKVIAEEGSKLEKLLSTNPNRNIKDIISSDLEALAKSQEGVNDPGAKAIRDWVTDMQNKFGLRPHTGAELIAIEQGAKQAGKEAMKTTPKGMLIPDIIERGKQVASEVAAKAKAELPSRKVSDRELLDIKRKLAGFLQNPVFSKLGAPDQATQAKQKAIFSAWQNISNVINKASSSQEVNRAVKQANEAMSTAFKVGATVEKSLKKPPIRGGLLDLNSLIKSIPGTTLGLTAGAAAAKKTGGLLQKPSVQAFIKSLAASTRK